MLKNREKNIGPINGYRGMSGLYLVFKVTKAYRTAQKF